MSIDPAITRRTLLAAGAGGLSVAALAACSSSGTKTAASTQPAADSSTPQSSAASSSSAGASSASSDDSGGSSSGEALVTLDSIAVGAAKSVKLPNGKPGIVSRTTSTNAVCFSAICTHEGCTVAPAKTSLDCPCHGSKYDLKTGKVIAGPAPSPLAEIAVKIEGGKVVAT